jgi:ABC-type uncharacterized transport system ATPase subunit
LERDVLEIRFTDDDASSVAARLLADQTIVEAGSDRVQIAVADSATTSLAVLRRLDDAGIELADFQLRRPTLDDVFLTLTRDSATEASS